MFDTVFQQEGFVGVLNSALTKQEPLPVTNTSVPPNCASNVQDNSITLLDVDESVGKASIHFE